MDRFNVVVFDADGYWHYVVRGIGPKQAVEIAKACVEVAETTGGLPPSGLVEVAKVIITDEDDFTNFCWERGKGVVFPPREGDQPPGGEPGAGSGGSRGPTPDLRRPPPLPQMTVRSQRCQTEETGRRRRRAHPRPPSPPV